MGRFVAMCVLVLAACGGSEGNPLTDGGGDRTNPSDGSAGDGRSDGGATFTGNPCLVLWLDAAKGVTIAGGLVTRWADQTTNQNHATQAIVLREPKLDPTAINNLPAVEFKSNVGTPQGNMLVLADSASLQWGTGDFLIAAVARFDNDPKDGLVAGAATFYSKFRFNMNLYTGAILLGNAPGMPYQPGVALSLASMTQASAQSTYNDGTFRLYLGRRSGVLLELRVNGAQVGMMTTPSIDVSASGSPATLGAEADANVLRLNGKIAELLACKGQIADGDLISLERYLTTKYGL